MTVEEKYIKLISETIERRHAEIDMFKLKCVRTEYTVNPIGVETQAPRFSWEYEAGENIIQKSYKILVASSPDLLFEGLADKWDSGIVFSRDCINIAYAGKELKSCELCYLKVFANTTNGVFESDIYTFEMGLFDKDWKISWRTCPLTASGAAIVFRRNFLIPPVHAGKTVTRARAYVCGLGYHEFYINGRKIGTGVFNPVLSDCNKRVYYNIYDITPFVKEKNAIGVLVGNGWFGAPQVTVNIFIRFEDGIETMIVTGEHERWWKARSSPIIAGTIFDGETYDARIEDELAGWSEYNEKFGLDNGWYFAVPKKHDKEVRLVSQKLQEIAVEKIFQSVKKRETAGGTVYDFGEMLTGRAVIKVKGERGAKITLRFSETLNKEGGIDRGSLRNAENTDVYILAGKEEEEFKPRFSYRGFRYVEVCAEGKAELREIVAEKLRTNTRQSGKFACSDEFLNRLHEISVRTESCNHHGILTDCPQRDERMGWLNDLSSRLFQTCNNFGMEIFFEKITDDITDTMDENGAKKDTAPYYLGGNVADPVSVAYLLIGKFAYERYGDTRIIEENYGNYKKWVEYLTGKTENGILPLGLYGDWCPAISVVPYISRRFNKGVPVPLISTMYLFWHYKLMAFFAEILGKSEETEKYSTLAEQTRNVINEKFYNRKQACYCDDVQSGNAMALSLGIAEEAERVRLLKAAVRDIENRGHHITCGNQAYRHLIAALADGGRNDVVMAILENKEYPSWGYMLACGATTVWERWEKEISSTEENMHSYCHPMFGSYDYWFYQYLAGIEVREGTPAMYDFIVKPCVTKEIPEVDCSLDTLLGRIAVSYKIRGDKVYYEITVPSNATAKVILPGEKPFELKSGVYKAESRL